MPPKVDLKDPAVAKLVELFATISLTGSRATETLSNPKHAAAVENAITELDLSSKAIDAKASALIVAATSPKSNLDKPKRDYLVGRILDGSLKSTDQVNGELPPAARMICSLSNSF